jgi:hypothetical protein
LIEVLIAFGRPRAEKELYSLGVALRFYHVAALLGGRVEPRQAGEGGSEMFSCGRQKSSGRMTRLPRSPRPVRPPRRSTNGRIAHELERAVQGSRPSDADGVHTRFSSAPARALCAFPPEGPLWYGDRATFYRLGARNRRWGEARMWVSCTGASAS